MRATLPKSLVAMTVLALAGCSSSESGGGPQPGTEDTPAGAEATGGPSTVASSGGAGASGSQGSTAAEMGMAGVAASAPMVSASTGVLDCSAPLLSGGTSHCSSNASGKVNGLTWTLWSSGTGGCLTTYGVGGALKATWNNSGDFLARVGLQWDETKTYDQYGTIGADFAYTKTGSGGGFSYIGIYGWSDNPLVEYYIVEDWFGRGPPTGGGQLQGTFNVDGAAYKIYTHTQTNQPSIHGTATFQQYYSVRQTPRQCGHVSITEHYKEWASLGLTLGKMYEAQVLVEAGGGVGSIDFTTATVSAQ